MAKTGDDELLHVVQHWSELRDSDKSRIAFLVWRLTNRRGRGIQLAPIAKFNRQTQVIVYHDDVKYTDWDK